MLPPQDRITDYRFIKSVNGVGIDVPHAFHQLSDNMAAYAWTVWAANTLAESHRGFNVGAMIVADDPENCRMGMYFGGNIKRLPGDDPDKICAERIALRKVREARFPSIVGVAVYGPYQHDSHTGRETLTLHPCGLCRSAFRIAPEMSDSTMFATHRKGEIIERFTLNKLLAEYQH